VPIKENRPSPRPGRSGGHRTAAAAVCRTTDRRPHAETTGGWNRFDANTPNPEEIVMPARLVSIDKGPDILLNRTLMVVGRHPACDARLNSLRVSRHHCCMTLEHGAVAVRDLGSTNGIRINGLRVESGRLRPGDELSIAHRRYRFDDGRNRNYDRERSQRPPQCEPVRSREEPAKRAILP
jgi:hypothetical protein